MINTTSEKWDEIIEEDSRLRRYENKSFPLFDSLDLLYEGQIAEGKHCFTSSQPSHVANTSFDLGCKNKKLSSNTRKHSQDASFDSRAQHPIGIGDGRDNIHSPSRMHESGRQGLENDIQDQEENNIYSCQRMDGIGRSLENELLQDHHDEQLDVEDNESNQPGRRGDDHPNSRTGTTGSQRGRLKKQKSTTSAPRIEETMAAYFDFRKEQTNMKEQASNQGNEYSISRCFEVLQAMDDVSDEIKIFASDVFKDAISREIFLCYEARLRGLWLKREVNKLGN